MGVDGLRKISRTYISRAFCFVRRFSFDIWGFNIFSFLYLFCFGLVKKKARKGEKERLLIC